MNKSDNSDIAPLVKVKLAKPHTHAGVKHEIGASIEVTEPEAAWLAENKITEAQPKPSEIKPK